ncbi:putative C-_U-editing enzyme APOBEC-4 [Xenopus laevis]|uniref:C->U-editing enzyme APOBEC-4 n=2 Tax=Xenopus laevis TaxID=8355 RepID=A0A974CZX8_XENLA|nr:putative C->U-editing enzyme APOBEC-4 [Xenopus laevis]OCT83094.1 hypothetical protein XELAEV_18025633mg [Xenopus laevis]
MENFFQEFAGSHGTLVKPYYWFEPNQNCSKCPYHIKTGEESRVTYGEFYEAFGFPYGPTMPENKQLIFYEVKDFSGTNLQKGQVTNCVISNLHAESILFEDHGYLDTLLCHHGTVGYITLYANYTPCNEYDHYCISKIYNFLLKHQDTRLDIYFSQLYHVEENSPAADWNRQALRSLASLWPRVTINPLSDGIWKNLLYNFAKGISLSALYQPILPARASADSSNAYAIHLITGIKPYFVDVSPASKLQEPNHHQESMIPKTHYNMVPKHLSGNYQYSAYPVPQGLIAPFPVPRIQVPQVASSKPRNVVRHLKMPGQVDMDEEFDVGSFIPNAKKINEVVITEKVVKDIDKEGKGYSKKKNKDK